MTAVDEIASIACEAKAMLCTITPMSDLWTPTAHVVTTTGRHVATLLDPELLAEPELAGLRVRLDIVPEYVAVGGVITEAHATFADTVEELPAPLGGGLAHDYATNPASAVTRALMLVTCTAEGVHAVRLLPYRWDDQGAPVWLTPYEVKGDVFADGVGAQIVALSEALAGVTP